MADTYRILIATHAVLTREQGAAQLALNLAESLRRNGHDVALWSPSHSQRAPWWKAGHALRKELDAFIDRAGPFDLVDAPPLMLTRKAATQGVSVARSVQPPLGYLACELSAQRAWPPGELVRLAARLASSAWNTHQVLGDWMRATHILALGQLEYAWMAKWLPFFRRRLSFYRPALSADEQSRLASIRRRRAPWIGPGVRFLWMGRWAPHKGIGRLIGFIRTRLAASPHDTVTIAGCEPGGIPEEWIASGRVRIVPEYGRADLPSLLESHDIGLFTSEVEGWGLSLNEMVESGIPVFATNAGGARDLSDACPGCISSFPPPVSIDVNALRARMTSLEPYYERLRWENVVELYEGLIRSRRAGDSPRKA